jgi:dienelactone hydrolase
MRRMRILWMTIMMSVASSAASIGTFIEWAAEAHGEAGKNAAEFLVEHMPAKDQESLADDFLRRNLELAFQARAEFPWAKVVPEEIFLNDVLPYAVFDETRDLWREEFLEKARPLVKDAVSSSEAAQALNREFFNIINVHYHTGRKAPNQSPAESMKTGRATCTGLSIILVNACRAVGIPARALGTPMWSNNRGNHTWVEIWDDGWRFTGADEYDPKGLDRGWFTGDAARAQADDPKHAIYATSWRNDGVWFPMVWSPGSRDVAAVNVTSRYAKPSPESGVAGLGVRLFDRKNGDRLVAKARVCDTTGRVFTMAETKAGTTDLNDMPRISLKPGTRGWMFFTSGGEVREMAFGPVKDGEITVDAVWTDLVPCSPALSALLDWLALAEADRPMDFPALKAALSKEEARKAVCLLGGDRLSRVAEERNNEFEAKALSHEGKTMRWLEKTFGDEPADGHSLWISMHGGGGAPAAVNDGQWRNQIRLYQPEEGIIVAPRGPTDTWNLWHEAHIDPMFQSLIESYVAIRGVNPNKVYLMGYSAGGDGVWQLAPRMADRFAAAAMMAGHPNEASLLGLRNLPFAIFMGENDAAYDRNKIAVAKAAELDRLEESDPGGYMHMSRIYEGLGHWMNGRDAEALPWMAKFERDPWPGKIVWLQDDVTHERFYWLRIPDKSAAKAGEKIIATVDGQTVRLEGDVPSGVALLLSDALFDLDQEVTVLINGRTVTTTRIPRTAETIRQSLHRRADLPAAATAVLVLP